MFCWVLEYIVAPGPFRALLAAEADTPEWLTPWMFTNCLVQLMQHTHPVLVTGTTTKSRGLTGLWS